MERKQLDWQLYMFWKLACVIRLSVCDDDNWRFNL